MSLRPPRLITIALAIGMVGRLSAQQLPFPMPMVMPANPPTPIIIRVIIEHTETFRYSFLDVAATALLAIVAYLPIVGEIRCFESPRDLIAGSNA